MLYLNIEEVSQADFKFMGAGSSAKHWSQTPSQTVTLSSQGQTIISKNIHFSKEQ